jgi:hypothetical protein
MLATESLRSRHSQFGRRRGSVITRELAEHALSGFDFQKVCLGNALQMLGLVTLERCFKNTHTTVLHFLITEHVTLLTVNAWLSGLESGPIETRPTIPNHTNGYSPAYKTRSCGTWTLRWYYGTWIIHAVLLLCGILIGRSPLACLVNLNASVNSYAQRNQCSLTVSASEWDSKCIYTKKQKGGITKCSIATVESG